MLYVVRTSPARELWRSTVADPTATADFEEGSHAFPAGLARFPARHHVAQRPALGGGRPVASELWRSTVDEPTTHRAL